MPPLKNYIGPTIPIGREILCLPYTGFFLKISKIFLEDFNIFKGKENSILWTEDYSKSLKCVFNLEMFPFDMQVTQYFKQRVNN